MDIKSEVSNQWHHEHSFKSIRFLIIYGVLLTFPFVFGYLSYPFLYAFFGIHWWLLPGCFLAITAVVASLFYGQLVAQIEAIRQQISKMNMLASIASGVGHNFNNRFNTLLVLINMYDLKYSQTIDIEGLPPERLRARYRELMVLLQAIKKESLLGFNIAKALRKFAMQPIKPQSFYLQEVVSSAFTLLSYKRKLSDFTLIENYCKPGPKLWASFANIQDVLFQLGDNAYDALAEKKYRIEEGRFCGDNFTPVITISANFKKRVCTVTVSDNGIGMDVQILRKIGKPFFSTKSNHNGHLGLGLWAVKRHLAINSSSLVVSSIYGKGTSFSFTLPYSSAQKP